jgi:hypothetical protein
MGWSFHHAQGLSSTRQLGTSSSFSGAVAGEQRRIISLVNWAPSNAAALFLAPLPGRKRRLLRGEFSHTHSLLCFIVLLYFIYFTCIVLYQNPKKLESLVVVFTCLLSFC